LVEASLTPFVLATGLATLPQNDATATVELKLTAVSGLLLLRC